jgi:hypothetical protein
MGERSDTLIPVELSNVGPFRSISFQLTGRLTVYRGAGKTTICRAVAGCLNPDRNRLGSYGILSRSIGHTGRMGSVWVGDACWTFHGDPNNPQDVRFGAAPFDTVIGYSPERSIGSELHTFGHGQRSDFGHLFDEQRFTTSVDVWMIKQEQISQEIPNPRYAQIKAAISRLLDANHISVGNFEMHYHFGDVVRSTKGLSHQEKRAVGLLVDIGQKVDHFKPTNGLCIIDGHDVGVSAAAARDLLDEAMRLWPELSFLVTEYGVG